MFYMLLSYVGTFQFHQTILYVVKQADLVRKEAELQAKLEELSDVDKAVAD